jgi:ribosomal peptide maturation radical SAM protein 1
MRLRPRDGSCLLVELPFRSIDQPSIGLSLIRQGILARGYKCEIRYENFEFARTIGQTTYLTISQHLPQEFLVGEAVFAPQVWDCDIEIDAISALRGGRTENRATGIPAHIVKLMPHLQRNARRFVEAVVNRIVEAHPILVGFSTAFFRLPSLAVARTLKQRMPDCSIVLGGANCEGEMGIATVRNFPYVDFVLQGEAEETLAKLLDAICVGQQTLESIEGLVWRDGTELCNNRRISLNQNLDSLPMPDYSDWFAQRSLKELPVTSNVALPLETSRGCWFGEKSHCIFCGLNGESLASRHKSAGRVIEELDGLRRYGVSNIFATDLIFPHAYFKTLLPVLAERRYGYSIYYETKSNLTRERLEQMRAAGINQLQPGIESLDSATLKKMRKGVSAYQNVRLLKWCVELSINVFWNILLHTPGESAESLQKTRELVPKITHLRPPVDGCVTVRVDRFSPMHADPQEFGIVGLAPSPGYSLAYRLSDEEIQALAYHFVPSCNSKNHDYEVAASQLANAVHHWHKRAGRASLILMHHTCGALVLDRRSDQSVEIELSPTEAAILHQANGGILRQRVAPDANRVLAEAAIDRLVGLSLLHELDGLLLALPTVFNMGDLLSGLPAEEGLALAHVVHCERMRRMCEASGLNLDHCEETEDGSCGDERSAFC